MLKEFERSVGDSCEGANTSYGMNLLRYNDQRDRKQERSNRNDNNPDESHRRTRNSVGSVMTENAEGRHIES